MIQYRARNSWDGYSSQIHILELKMVQGIIGPRDIIVKGAKLSSRFLSKPGKKRKMLTVCKVSRLLIPLVEVLAPALAQ